MTAKRNAEAWRAGLLRTKARDGRDARVRSCPANVMHVLGHHPDWQGVLAFDELREAVVTMKPPPCRDEDRPTRHEAGEWTDDDTARTGAWLSRVVDVDFSRDAIEQGVVTLAHRCPTHPVREYLHALKWDGAARVERWLTTYLGVDDTPYARAVGKAWLVSAVARVERPGCQADHLLILEGPQGAGKSSAIRVLASDRWLNESGVDVTDAREAVQALRGFWIVSFDELDNLRRAEVRSVKAFLTLTADSVRPAYARRVRTYLRQCVFIATTNEDAYLSDPTGGRRFWPVIVGAIDLQALARDRDQIWAEACNAYKHGSPWYLADADVERLARIEQSARVEEDVWTAPIAAWLDKARLTHAHGVTTADVLLGAHNVERARQDRAHASRVGAILRLLGWQSKQRRENGERVRRYLPSQLLPHVASTGRDTARTGTAPTSQVTTRHNHARGTIAQHEPPEVMHAPPLSAVTRVTNDEDSYDAAERAALEDAPVQVGNTSELASLVGELPAFLPNDCEGAE
jgi:putative DNA primase/helicase